MSSRRQHTFLEPILHNKAKAAAAIVTAPVTVPLAVLAAPLVLPVAAIKDRHNMRLRVAALVCSPVSLAVALPAAAVAAAVAIPTVPTIMAAKAIKDRQRNKRNARAHRAAQAQRLARQQRLSALSDARTVSRTVSGCAHFFGSSGRCLFCNLQSAEALVSSADGTCNEHVPAVAATKQGGLTQTSPEPNDEMSDPAELAIEVLIEPTMATPTDATEATDAVETPAAPTIPAEQAEQTPGCQQPLPSYMRGTQTSLKRERSSQERRKVLTVEPWRRSTPTSRRTLRD